METTWPRSSSPCSGVLKFRLASNASANVASAVSLDWVMGLLDTFREVDPGPRDRLGSVCYSKAIRRATRTGVRGSLRRRNAFHSRKTGRSERRAGSRRTADPARCSLPAFLSQTLARCDVRTYINGPCRAGCSMADVNGAEGRPESRWDSWRGDADAALRLLTRGNRCDGQRTSERSIRMPSGGCQRIENGPARPEIAGLFVFGRTLCAPTGRGAQRAP